MKKTLIALAISQGCSAVVLANDNIEETLVIGVKSSYTVELTENTEPTTDSAQLLRRAPGANFNSNGPVTGIAQMRGMFGSRVHVGVNGQSVAAGGPNWMDPPLSYAPPALLESITVYRGIAPVSVGQESIGGAIHAQTWWNDFSSSGDVEFSGRARAGYHSINHGNQLSTLLGVASESHKGKLALLSESAGDAEFKHGEITPTEFERQRFDLGYGFQRDNHTFQFEGVRNETGDSGTPALPMDIQYIDSDLASMRYSFENTSLKLNGRIYVSDIKHGMTNYHLRMAPSEAGRWRRNIATGENKGFAFDLKLARWKFGLDYHDEIHNSNIDNPNNAMFYLQNFNNASRTVTGLFSEYTPNFVSGMSAEFGLRVNRVTMDSDTVNGTPAMMMPAAKTLRDNFNGADRSQSNINIDAVAKVQVDASDSIKIYAGLAQKTRSPSYQERYLWIPLEATAGLADGRTYTGNIELEPEVAHELETGVDFLFNAFSASPRVFYREVSDYIQGTTSSSTAAVMVAGMMGMSTEPPLEFNNVDAVFYGFDIDWHYKLSPSLSLDGIVNYVRGKRDDIDDNLYRIAPTNATTVLNFSKRHWGLSLESVLYAKQHKVSVTQSEKTTAGYGLVNVKGFLKINNKLKISTGINNIFDKHYQEHLAGYNRVMGSDITLRERLPGYGRNIYLQLNYLFSGG